MDRAGRDEWERLCAYGEARFRACLQAEGLDPDRMTDEEKMDFVDRMIHEFRGEEAASGGPAL